MTICLDDRTVAGDVCQRHRDAARADIRAWMFGMREIAGHRRPEKPGVVTGAPTVEFASPSSPRHRVPVPRTRRVVELPDDEPPVTPHVPRGVNLGQLKRAVDVWRMPDGVRSRLAEKDIDPVDAFVTAEGDGPEYPDDDGITIVKAGRDITVLLDIERHVILDARRIQRRQGQ